MGAWRVRRRGDDRAAPEGVSNIAVSGARTLARGPGPPGRPRPPHGDRAVRLCPGLGRRSGHETILPWGIADSPCGGPGAVLSFGTLATSTARFAVR